MSTTFISPILCLSPVSHTKLQRSEFSFPVIFTQDNIAITEFPITLFSKNINSVQRGLFLDMKNGIIRNGTPDISQINVENRIQLGHRRLPLKFSLIQGEDKKESSSGEIIGIGTEVRLDQDDSNNLMNDQRIHYFDVEVFEKDDMFARSWTCPSNHHVYKIVLFRKNNELVAMQLLARKFEDERKEIELKPGSISELEEEMCFVAQLVVIFLCVLAIIYLMRIIILS